MIKIFMQKKYFKLKNCMEKSKVNLFGHTLVSSFADVKKMTMYPRTHTICTTIESLA